MIKPWIGGSLPRKAVFFFFFLAVGIIAGVYLGNIGRSKLQKVTVVAQTEKIPAFEVATYKIKSRSIGRLTEDKRLLGMTYGSATLVYTYEAWVTLGVKEPENIKIRREGNEVFVDASTIVVTVLDSKTENYQRIGFDTSNPLVPKTVLIDTIFGSQVDDRSQAEALAIAEENMSAAKDNFMDNYEKLCAAVGLKVNWE
ncbi:MAG: hypothetical protein LBB40_03345 [Holophagales bacterium]|jgi:hypothetical protein|nr:hypothetical protein [Holophagales bacterium]